MTANKRTAFYYHSHANALGGSLRQPLERVFSTPASVSLAAAGGYSSARAERFHVDGLISFETAHVRVSGSERKDKGGWRTVTAAIIERLNIMEVLTADRIVAQVSVDHPPDRHHPISVTLLGSRFDNLRVHGSEVKPTFDPKIFGAQRANTAPGAVPNNAPLTFPELVKIAESQHKLRVNAKHPPHVADRLQFEEPETELSEKGTALCSLVETVGVAAPVESYGHMLHIPDFGNVFLGELLVNRASAALTMLRVEMGCMADGDVSACSAMSVGRTMP